MAERVRHSSSAGDGVEAEAEEDCTEEGQNEEGQDEDVDVVTIDDEPEPVNAEEVQPTPNETQLMLLTLRTFSNSFGMTRCAVRMKGSHAAMLVSSSWVGTMFHTYQ